MKVVSRGATPQSGTCHSCLASPKIKALPEIKAGVIVADPEWCFEPRSREIGMHRAAEAHDHSCHGNVC